MRHSIFLAITRSFLRSKVYAKFRMAWTNKRESNEKKNNVHEPPLTRKNLVSSERKKRTGQ
jgi:hypothetical protein